MFVLIMGVTGSGKTTIGTLLSAAMGWPFYDADDFHSPDNEQGSTVDVVTTCRSVSLKVSFLILRNPKRA